MTTFRIFTTLLLACGLGAHTWAQTPPAAPPRPSATPAPVVAPAPAKAPGIVHVPDVAPLVEAIAADVAALAETRFALEAEAAALAQATLAGQEARQSSEKERAERIEQRAREMAERSRLRIKERSERDHAVYQRGTAALDAGRWSQAAEAFAQAAAQKGSRADGALYWKAYAEYKLAQQAAALATLQELKKGYPESRWLKEANALQVEISGHTGAPSAASDDELKLLAISGLLQADPDQALPMLEKILTSQQSPQLKRRALFVLSQSKAPRAREVVISVAKGGSNPDLQLEAVRYLGAYGDAQTTKTLSGLYATSTDIDVKRRILEAYLMTGQRELMFQAATSESNPELRLQAVRLLGAMRANTELNKLYETESSADVRLAIVEGFMVSGDATRLVQIARSDKDMTLRLKAVEMLGALRRDGNAAVLNELYHAQGQSLDIKRAAINGLFIAGDARSLVDIARKETDSSLRKAVVERLSVMKSKEATDYLMEIISK